jgi:hypothetical protein
VHHGENIDPIIQCKVLDEVVGEARNPPRAHTVQGWIIKKLGASDSRRRRKRLQRFLHRVHKSPRRILAVIEEILSDLVYVIFDPRAAE